MRRATYERVKGDPKVNPAERHTAPLPVSFLKVPFSRGKGVQILPHFSFTMEGI